MKTTKAILILTLQVTLSASAQKMGSGGCLDFDGVSNYTSATHNAIYDFGANDFTIETWIKPHSVSSTSGRQRIISRWNNAVIGQRGYVLEIEDDDIVRLILAPLGANSNQKFEGQCTLKNNVWQHVAAVRKNGLITLYLNGVAVSTPTPFTAALDLANPVPLVFGRYNLANNNGIFFWYDGELDEVRLWSKGCSQNEIRDSMCKKLLGTENFLIGYWRLDDLSGLTAADDSPTSNPSVLY